MNDASQNEAIAARIAEEKTRMLEALKQMPIVQVACQKAGVGRTTYYNWRREDAGFAKAADNALYDGELFMCDMSETQLLALIKEKHFPSIMAWLKHHHPKYSTRIEVTANINREEQLNAEEQALVAKALSLSGMQTYEKPKRNSKR